ncbi:DNA-directed RNA polymerase subunit omega [Helcococcus ovis]|uniref:DNA-directed RNA polymerase subunit omega n=1 Tax=Helcococcus ovis TaxID=72026 RepID=A0A4R9C5D0_9FIRM|nr:DNA-directed RNA polymerase subunit omega [Helcococcus ovis]TFF63929.1 DNA-directed RNA polymerase subunit omega [Helcococcus ovis]TFF67135.1 DNA-directed RNA polymerase subunit omega [Helcococcus ovis]TFF67971.1 DNA-directed RNA polymerase subunit omega [Helcococcus ovis]WNZ01925.1 DNA-directed RNA polymerase subunit omega [Helcococcus ovis]
MINPSFRELEKVSKSRYDIAMMTAKRAKELIAGDKPKVKTKAAKPVTVALTEIMEGKIESED